MIFYFALLVTPKRRELRRKILAQIEHIVHRAKILLALSKALARYRTKIKCKYREMIFYFALLVTPKRRELRRKILAQIEHIVHRAKILLALSKALARRRALSELGKAPGS